VPTEWYPTALAVKGNKLYVATAKGQGTGPNSMPQAQVPGQPPLKNAASTYIATLLHGSMAAIDLSKIDAHRQQLTRTVIETNMMKAAQQKIAFRNGTNPIRHVVYIIKENRTYDQILGDLGTGNGMPALTMYGEAITPNEHKLAKQFGVLDNFYDSGEVSGDGHVWSNAAISSDYNEKTWQQSYRGKERVYDYEGVVENGYPLREGFSDINEPTADIFGQSWPATARPCTTSESSFRPGSAPAQIWRPRGHPRPREHPNLNPRSVERGATSVTAKRFRKIMAEEPALIPGQFR
jgi:hypothetical protein